MLQTEFPFTLLLGYRDGDGNLHREGVMRLATAADETGPLGDPRVHSNPGYWVILLLSRVVVSLGTLERISPDIIEGLYAADLKYLENFYLTLNNTDHARMRTFCPHCEQGFDVELRSPGGVWRYPLERMHEEMAYVAYHFHWPPDQIYALEHAERARWVAEIGKINMRLNAKQES